MRYRGEMGDITVLLQRARDNDRAAIDALFELLYDDLRRLARSRLAASGRQTLLDTSALVHEAYLRFQRADRIALNDREHFQAALATAIEHLAGAFGDDHPETRRARALAASAPPG